MRLVAVTATGKDRISTQAGPVEPERKARTEAETRVGEPFKEGQRWNEQHRGQDTCLGEWYTFGRTVFLCAHPPWYAGLAQTRIWPQRDFPIDFPGRGPREVGLRWATP